MLRIYCDTNIYSILKDSHPSFNQDLKDTFESLNKIMLFTFSDAHLDDLHNSIKEYRDNDLILMEKYVKDNYFSHDFVTEKKTTCYLASPYQAYHDKDYEAYNNVLGSNFDINSLFDGLENDNLGGVIKNMMKTIFNMPINNSIYQPENPNEKSLEWHNKLFTDKKVTTLGESINQMFSFGQNLLADEKEVTSLRNYIQSYVDRGDYSFENWGDKFDIKFKETQFGQSFSEIIEQIYTSNEKNYTLYDKFILYYSSLEMLNITKETTGKKAKAKKFNFSSLNTDAQHAWYASFSDYLVTDDKGLQIKAYLTYKYFKIPTKIISSYDFLNSKTLTINQEETYESLMKSLIYDMENSFQLYSQQDLINGNIVNTYKTTYPYFNYFNRIQVYQYEETNKYELTLYCERTDNSNYLMFRELESITNKLVEVFGNDFHSKGQYNFETEKRNQENIIREWKVGNLLFSLLCFYNGRGSFIALQIIPFKE